MHNEKKNEVFPTRRALELAACLLLATGCAAADGAAAGAPVDDREVRDAQRYLTAYGYLPNDELAASFPSWRPLVSARPTPGMVLDAEIGTQLFFRTHRVNAVAATFKTRPGTSRSLHAPPRTHQ